MLQRALALCGISLVCFLLVGCGGSKLAQTERATDQPVEPTVNELAGNSNLLAVFNPDPAPQKQKKVRQPRKQGRNAPFPRRFDMPDFPRTAKWMNTRRSYRLRDFKGKFVILDFWTYCCINCIHILPHLKKLEKKYPNELVVVGVHSAKFETEKDAKNISEAILRYEIEHPVVNDANHRYWNTLGINSWPTVLMIDPEGKLVWGRRGEITFKQVDEVLKRAIPYYRRKKLIDPKPIRFELLQYSQKKTPLKYPGKVLADEKSNRLFITDSNHNRIVISTLDGKLLDIIGSGRIGRENGSFEKASFDHPQGVALHNDTLYVADTENHMLRKVNLKTRQVTTISGTGEQSRNPWPGYRFGKPQNKRRRFLGNPKGMALNSPWALWVHGKNLYIAMAGPHQIWRMTLTETVIGPYAGNGREDIVDGDLLPGEPYEAGYSSFAQPSGLASDGTWLYVADSEGSSIRAVPFDPKKQVKTVVGTAHLFSGRLFHFGDRDGPRNRALLQHALGVVYHNNLLYIADTYNNKIKTVHPVTGVTKTLVGTKKPGKSNSPGSFDEPAGISYAKGKLYVADTNNHLIRTIDLSTGNVATLTIQGLKPPKEVVQIPKFSTAERVRLKPQKVAAQGGKIALQVNFAVPKGWKINPLAPMKYYLSKDGKDGVLAIDKVAVRSLKTPAAQFTFTVPVKSNGKDVLRVAMQYYYCEDVGKFGGVCKIGSVVFTVPIEVRADGGRGIVLPHKIIP